MKLSPLPKVTHTESGRTRLHTQGAYCLASTSDSCSLEVGAFSGSQVRPSRCRGSACTHPGIQARVLAVSSSDSSSSPAMGQTLSLKNISTDMSGYYICISSNEVGMESCNITLAVRPRKSHCG